MTGVFTSMGTKRKLSLSSHTATVLVIYGLIGVVWLVLSDPLLDDFPKHPWLVRISRIVFFVFLGMFLAATLIQRRTMRATLNEYGHLIHTLQHPIFIHTGGTIIQANEFAAQLLGATSANELVGKAVRDIVHPSSWEWAASRIEQVVQGLPSVMEPVQLITLQGDVRYVDIMGIPIRCDGAPAVQAIVKDNTARKRAEDQLRQYAELFTLIEENMADSISVMDADRQILYASPSHRRLLGDDDYILDGRFNLAGIHPEDQERVVKQYNSGQPFRVEFRLLRQNGSWITVDLAGTPVVDETGAMQKMVLSARDVTDRRQTEELLRETDKLSIVGRLAAGVAHELRNPMTSIKGFLHLMQPLVSDDAKRYVDIIGAEIGRIESIANELLVVAKPKATHFDYKRVATVLEEVIALLSPEAALHSITINYSTRDEDTVILCDENQVKQVFVNVIKNAIEAMANGGRITVTTTKENGTASIQFEDEGVGLTEEQLEKLGTPFYSTKTSGTGLGIMVSQRIITQHGGVMRFYSTYGEGTSVVISLPVATSPEVLVHP